MAKKITHLTENDVAKACAYWVQCNMPEPKKCRVEVGVITESDCNLDDLTARVTAIVQGAGM